MLAYADFVFTKERPTEGGSAESAHYRQLEKATGKRLIDPPSLPVSLELLWEYFCELSAARCSNGFGPNPLTYTEIDAWCHRMKVDLEPFEVQVIRKLDSAFLSAYARSSQPSHSRSKP